MIRLKHYDLEFGIDISEWGDRNAAEIAGDYLRGWVTTLSATEAKALHRALTESDRAYGDDPVWDRPEMIDLHAAQVRARNAGLAASAAPSQADNHGCICRLLPLPYKD